MIYRFSARQFIVKQLALLLASALIGYWFGHVWLVLWLVTAVNLALHYRHLLAVIQWLWHKNLLYPPESNGIWGHVYDGIYRRIRYYRSRQKQLNFRIKQYRDGAEALPDAAVVLDLNYKIGWSNKKANRLLGIRWPQDSGQRITNLVRSLVLNKYVEKSDFSEPCALVSPENPNQQLELRFMNYGDDQYLLLARDVSQLKRIEKMRRDFVANVSHELKTPLTVMRGYVEMMQDHDSMPTQWQKSLRTVEDQVTRMDRLVQQLLVLSRVESHNEDDIRHQINLPKLIDAVMEDIYFLNQEKQHELILDITPELGILGVESELKSACSNLIVNAMSYTQHAGTIKISWQKVNDKCIFSVEDNGCGIAEQDILRLSERFYRVDKSRSRDTGGTGLGLAIVKHVATNHKGRLKIRSELGKGSCFSLEFPVEESFRIVS
ncbi:phosphate regulon sensor histidine kinase PhoR [Thalassotalea maritima]|uniref:phosphate regulon sensor histidine kinase PhoR n=1 Tax=Thalassotalea maritima TaxID=3242416 RepID=UPI00352813B8